MRTFILLFCSLVLGWAEKTHALIPSHDFFVRGNRPFFIGCQLYEFAVFSRVFPWETPDHSRVFRSTDSLRQELLEKEEWKFREFAQRDYLTSDAERLVGDKVRQIESILKHDEIFVLYSWIPTGGAPGIPFREPIALGAIKRLTADADSTLLLEDHQRLLIDRPVPVPISAAEFGPMHWRLSGADLSKISFYRGDVMQINSLVLRRELGPVWLPYFYTLAYWHGLSNTGRIIPGGMKVKIAGVEIPGPAILQPTFFVGEGYGARATAFERLQFQKVPVDGQLVFPDADSASVSLSLMMADQHRFLIQLPQTFSERLAGPQHGLDPTFMGPLSLAPMDVYGRHLPRESVVPLSHEAEAHIAPICVWEVALGGVPRQAGPLQTTMDQHPKAHFRRD